MIASYYITGLQFLNAYVESKQGFIMGKEILKMNHIAMTHIATKWALANDMNDDDLAALTCVGTSAVLGGQSAFYFYRDNLKGKGKEKPHATAVGAKDERATNPTTGKPTAGAPPVVNGTTTATGAITVVRQPGGGDPFAAYG
jgi:hypothetical protein